jgi:hypothetical protein
MFDMPDYVDADFFEQAGRYGHSLLHDVMQFHVIDGTVDVFKIIIPFFVFNAEVNDVRITNFFFSSKMPW